MNPTGRGKRATGRGSLHPVTPVTLTPAQSARHSRAHANARPRKHHAQLSAAPLFTAFAAAPGGGPGDDISARDVEFAVDLYTGQEANGPYVDLSTLTIEHTELPVLLQHDPARVIGIQTVTNDGHKLTTKGRLFTIVDAGARADVIERHRAAWADHRKHFTTVDIAANFEIGKSAKISSEMRSIRQKGERAAYGLDDSSASEAIEIVRSYGGA